MHGAHDGGSEYDVGRISLEISFIARDIYDYSDRLRMLANWLRPDEGVGEYVADHEPDKTYYAKLASTSISRIELIAKMGEGTIELICPDPFAYGKEITQSLNQTVANAGTMDAYPVFDLTVKQDTDMIYIGNYSNQNEFGDHRGIALGSKVDIDEEVEERKRLIMHDTMQSTSGWTGASNVDSGYVSGQMGTDDEGFYVESWGDEDEDGKKPDWIGPSLERTFSEQLKSFVADIKIANRNEFDKNGRKILAGVGIIEVYLRDINDNLVAKMSFGDSHGSSKAENSGRFTVDGDGRRMIWKPSGYNDFNGILRITRDTESFYGYIASMTAGGQHYKVTEVGPIVPRGGSAENRVAKIQVAIRKYIGAQRIYQRIKEIKVWSAVGTYEYPDKRPVDKFNAGDQIHIDTRPGQARILVNGEERGMQLGSEFFTLVEGINELDYNPDLIEGTISFRNRYL